MNSFPQRGGRKLVKHYLKARGDNLNSMRQGRKTAAGQAMDKVIRYRRENITKHGAEQEDVVRKKGNIRLED